MSELKKVRITVVRMASYKDLSEIYENPIQHSCDMKLGMTFVSENGEKPDSMCDSAWESMEKFVKALSRGEGNFYDGWMKDPYSAMISCNDGFRPVSFFIETLQENLTKDDK